ncbi:MAG: response regulator transcription factor [Bacteroidota bacterium]
MIRVVVADDHQMVLDGLKLLLDQEENIETVGEASNGFEVIKILAREQVDVVVLDIEMPKLDGIDTAKRINDEFPEVKILILSMYNNEEFIKSLIQVGVSGYILKNRGREELVEAVNHVAQGGEYFGAAVTKTLISSLKKPKKSEKEKVQLTRREIDVLKLIAEGLSTPQIGEKLFIAPSTVDTHRRNLIDKTGVPNSKALIRYAIQNGFLEE